jgi:hypothetical protein
MSAEATARRGWGAGRGTALELAVRREFDASGYRTMRAAASQGSIKADIIAIKPGQVVFVQAKRHGPKRAASGRAVDVPPAEWNALLEAALWVPGRGGVALIATGIPTSIMYYEITGMKGPGTRAIPWRAWTLDEVAAEPAHAGALPVELTTPNRAGRDLLDRLTYPPVGTDRTSG